MSEPPGRRARHDAYVAGENPHAPPGVLFTMDIARILTDEARKPNPQRKRKANPDRAPISAATVWSYGKESRIRGGRYLDNPCPQPDGYSGRNMNGPWWYARREQEWRDWYNSRPGQGHGTGGRRAGSTRPDTQDTPPAS